MCVCVWVEDGSLSVELMVCVWVEDGSLSVELMVCVCVGGGGGGWFTECGADGVCGWRMVH